MFIERLVDLTSEPAPPEDLYKRIGFPEPPQGRPYVFINMVSTVDGKIVLDKPDGPARGVGGPTDQVLFRRLQHNADAALIGGNTLRASQVIYPAGMARFAVTRSGDLPLENRFFLDAPDRAYVILPGGIDLSRRKALASAATLIETGTDEVEWRSVLRTMRDSLGIRTLLCEGGGQLNEQLVRLCLVDELFVTFSAKLKGGAHLPTILEGTGFPPLEFLPVELLSVYRDGSELYLRYRLADSPEMPSRVASTS